MEQMKVLQDKVHLVSAACVPKTVALVTEDGNSSGSGVITSAEGLILTAAHVVQGNNIMDVIFPDGKKCKGKVLGANFSRDLAMVKILDKGTYPFAERGSSKKLKIGDWVIAMGHAAGFDAKRPPPVRFGSVISLGPGNFFTTSCTLIGGDSGGPVFDLDGKIIGINSNIGQAVKVNNHAGVDGFNSDWKKMLGGEQWGELKLDPAKNADMPILGVDITNTTKGPIVARIRDKGKAAEGGIQVGDIIKEVEGEVVRNGDDVFLELVRKQGGDTVKLKVLRDQKVLELKVQLVSRGDLEE